MEEPKIDKKNTMNSLMIFFFLDEKLFIPYSENSYELVVTKHKTNV